MALPNQIDQSTPPGSQSPALGDDRIREFKLAVEDILGIPDATNVSAAGFTFAAAGLSTVNFQNVGDPGTAGYLGRNSTLLKWHDGTAARTVYTVSGTDVALADGGTGASLTDPGADRLMFWDDSETSVAFLTVAGLAISTTTISPDPTRSTQDVTTSETTTSTSYTDLATSGPAVTLTPGRATDQVILFGGRLSNNTTFNTTFMSVAIAGAGASDADALVQDATANHNTRASSHILATSVASGSTHTAKYRVSGNTGTFLNRRISAYTLT